MNSPDLVKSQKPAAVYRKEEIDFWNPCCFLDDKKQNEHAGFLQIRVIYTEKSSFYNSIPFISNWLKKIL